jgi:hypothetical protein
MRDHNSLKIGRHDLRPDVYCGTDTLVHRPKDTWKSLLTPCAVSVCLCECSFRCRWEPHFISKEVGGDPM